MANLYTWSGNSNAQAAQATAALNNVNLNVNEVVPGEAIEGFPAFASAPCLKANGKALTQLASILVELGGSADPQTLEWISFAENVICPNACAWVFPTLGAMPNNKGAVAEGKKNLLAALEHLNAALATKTFLVGERPSAADAAVVASLNLAFKQVLSEEYRKNIPHVARWFQTCVNQPEFNSFGKTALCDKEAQFDAKTFGELNKKGGKDNKKAAAPKKEKAKQEAKPKAEKKKEEKPADAGDAPLALPPKKKDPWADLGGKYDMDAWKRCYSNNDTIPVAMDYFWEKMDKENYSCWFGKYKYGEEIPQPFMASNLIRGMFQRLDKMRKHSFSSVAVLGEAPNLEISGVWFWKGQGLAFELCDDWKVDYDTYEWSKLDTDNAADRKKIQEYFAWEGDFDGKKFQDAKVFK